VPARRGSATSRLSLVAVGSAKIDPHGLRGESDKHIRSCRHRAPRMIPRAGSCNRQGKRSAGSHCRRRALRWCRPDVATARKGDQAHNLKGAAGKLDRGKKQDNRQPDPERNRHATPQLLHAGFRQLAGKSAAARDPSHEVAQSSQRITLPTQAGGLAAQ